MAEPALKEFVAADRDIEVVWRAFELRPEPVPALDPDGEYLHRVWNDSVYPLAARLGIEMKLPPVQPRSRRAHEAAHWARSEGRFEEYNEALFRAIFERGENIGELEVLAALAENIGLNGESLKGALGRHEFLESVLTDEQEAEMLGVSGVPAFVADRRAALSGVQPAENLRRLIESVRR